MHTTHSLLRFSRSRVRMAAVCAVIALGSSVALRAAAANDETPRLVLRNVSATPDTAVEAEELYARIRSAARRVCSDHDGRSLRQWQAYRACVSDTVAQTVAELDSPALADEHRRAVEGQARRVVSAGRSAPSATT